MILIRHCEHVPAHTASVRDRRRLSPWFDDDRRQSRRRSRAFERHYRRSCTANDWRGVDKSVPCTPSIPGQGESVLVYGVVANAGNSKLKVAEVDVIDTSP